MSSSYEFANNFNEMVLNDVPDAQVAGDELERVRKKNGGAFTPEDVVEASRPKRAKLHKSFEWDDSIAGERFRVEQAKSIVRSIRPVKVKGEPTVPRSFTSVRRQDEPKKREYRKTEVVMAEPLSRDEILMNCLSQLMTWRRRWAEYNELAEAVELVQKATKSIEALVET